MQFNILLTTYEMVMRDSQRLNKIEWRRVWTGGALGSLLGVGLCVLWWRRVGSSG